MWSILDEEKDNILVNYRELIDRIEYYKPEPIITKNNKLLYLVKVLEDDIEGLTQRCCSKKLPALSEQDQDELHIKFFDLDINFELSPSVILTENKQLIESMINQNDINIVYIAEGEKVNRIAFSKVLAFNKDRQALIDFFKKTIA